MAQQLGALDAFAKDLHLIPSTHMVAPDPGDPSSALSRLPQAPPARGAEKHTQNTCTQ